MDCTSDWTREHGLHFRQVRAKEGFWTIKYLFVNRQPELKMERCYNAADGAPMCLGGKLVADKNFTSNSLCTSGKQGPLCANCLPGYVKDANKLCVKCSPAEADQLRIVLAALIVLAILYGLGTHRVLIALIAPRCPPRLIRWFALSDKTKNSLRTKTKILIGLAQVLSAMKDNFEVPWPKAFTDFAERLSFLNLEFFSWSALACAAKPNFLGVLLFDFFLPMAALLFLFIAHKVCRRFGIKSQLACRHVCLRYVFFLLFLIYPRISITMLKTFRCRELVDGYSYLVADMTIRCDATTYNEQVFGVSLSLSWMLASKIALAGVVLYPIGIPLLFARQVHNVGQKHPLYDANGKITPEAEARVGFLCASYEPQFWYV
jgi:hypothetical protein